MNASELMAVTPFCDEKAIAWAVAREIAEEIRRKPDLTLCAATGASPAGTYRELGRIAEQEPELFRSMRLVKLDEWGGLAMNHPATCEYYLRRRLIEPLGVAGDRYLGFESNPADPAKECARVANELRHWGPIDICVLGIGLNGHLGLNEPAPELKPGCHVAVLSESARRHGMLAAERADPRYGMTLGLGDILQSRRIVLIAFGASKREPVARMYTGGITTHFPASFLRLHSNTSVYVDGAACPVIATDSDHAIEV